LIQKSSEANINNGRLAKMTYHNGDAVSFGYDLFDRITSETYTTTNGSNMTIHNEYSSEGDLVKKYSQNQQGVTTEAYVYNYDSLGRLIHSREYNNGSFALQTSNYYDISNRPKQQSWTDGTAAFSQTLSYNGDNDMLDSVNRTIKPASQTYNVNTSYSYDELLRLTGKETTFNGTNAIKREYTYKDFANSNRTSAQVETMSYKNSNGDVTVGAKYEYNSAGNLYKVYPFDTSNNNYSSLAYQTYNYDTLGQLSSVNDYAAGCVYDYTYDTAGNIRKIEKDPYNSSTTTVIELSYTDPIWRDRLTTVKVGNTTGNIVYESVGSGFISGNPISYYNGRSYSFTWQNGRQLSTASVGNTNVSYSYDMSGLRSSKTVDGETYSYNTINGQVVSQKWDTKTLWFIYDEEGQPFALIYQGGANAGTSIYFYALNAQGDVVALLDPSGDVEAEYRYDPWGAVTVIPNNNQIGNLNPLRYRGYYYDSEAELYYLQSRYYDPALGRFINADTCATTDPDGFLSCNMFSYCENDPVNRRDITGFFPQVVLGAFVGALWGIADACIAAALSGEDIGNAALEGALTGAIQGALIAGAGPLAAMIWSGISTTLIDYGLQALAGTNVNHVNAAANGVCSFIGSSVSIGANYLLRNSGGIMGRTVVRLTENLFNTTMQTGVIGYCKDSNFSNTAVTQNPPPVSKPGGNNKRVAFGPVPTTV
jgi:RHS repeat-associated protein